MTQPQWLNVETDGLTDAMTPVYEHISAVLKTYLDAVGGIGPVVDALNAEADPQILAQSNNEMEATRWLLVALQGLSVGDGESIALLRANFEAAEDQAIDQAGGWTGRH